MNVRVRYFAAFREATGIGSEVQPVRARNRAIIALMNAELMRLFISVSFWLATM